MLFQKILSYLNYYVKLIHIPNTQEFLLVQVVNLSAARIAVLIFINWVLSQIKRMR